MTHFLLRISEKKWDHISFGEILSNFCSLHFLSNLNPIWEKRVWKFKFCSFCPDNLNQHCISGKFQHAKQTSPGGIRSLQLCDVIPGKDSFPLLKQYPLNLRLGVQISNNDTYIRGQIFKSNAAGTVNIKLWLYISYYLPHIVWDPATNGLYGIDLKPYTGTPMIDGFKKKTIFEKVPETNAAAETINSINIHRDEYNSKVENGSKASMPKKSISTEKTIRKTCIMFILSTHSENTINSI